jgi:hypothetical protein
VSINDDVSHYIYILMHIISTEFQPTMKVNIYNQCSGFKLVDRKCSNVFMNWNKKPDMEVDSDSMMSADLISYWATFEGSLTYQLQEKRVISSNRRKSKTTLLFVAWKSEGYKMLRVLVQLIECDKQTKWNPFKLEEYRQRCANQLNVYTGFIEDIWLIHDGTVLITRLGMKFMQGCHVLNISISEGVMNRYDARPIWINPKL